LRTSDANVRAGGPSSLFSCTSLAHKRRQRAGGMPFFSLLLHYLRARATKLLLLHRVRSRGEHPVHWSVRSASTTPLTPPRTA
jgi:hypothetical protein